MPIGKVTVHANLQSLALMAFIDVSSLIYTCQKKKSAFLFSFLVCPWHLKASQMVPKLPNLQDDDDNKGYKGYKGKRPQSR
eukprot:1157863-Pelagomonas_calceolata.AAC.7